eukprot:1194322-Prorocentrum_minimum.AAC.7
MLPRSGCYVAKVRVLCSQGPGAMLPRSSQGPGAMLPRSRCRTDVSTFWWHASPATVFTHPTAADAGCRGNRTDSQSGNEKPPGKTKRKNCSPRLTMR